MDSIVLYTIIGAVCGSLLAWLGRALMDTPGSRARSTCDLCRRKLAWWELIPIFSYLGLGGKCRTCGTSIMLADWSMEVIGAILFGVGAWRFTVGRDLIWWLLLAFGTMLIFYIDVRWMVVPRSFAVVVSFIALLAQWTWTNFAVVLLAALLGTIFYFFLYAISSGRWVGDGDVALGFIAGAAAGDVVHLGYILFVAHILGAAVATGLILIKKKKFGEALPMGAFLLPAVWVVVLWVGWH